MAFKLGYISNFRGYVSSDGLDAFYSEKPGIAYVLGAHLGFLCKINLV
jgi:hypothetical protein